MVTALIDRPYEYGDDTSTDTVGAGELSTSFVISLVGDADGCFVGSDGIGERVGDVVGCIVWFEVVGATDDCGEGAAVTF